MYLSVQRSTESYVVPRSAELCFLWLRGGPDQKAGYMGVEQTAVLSAEMILAVERCVIEGWVGGSEFWWSCGALNEDIL
ncbi:hypothetical protein MRB53_005197 [Persea americana]|uniref:Uncharacterized protein n=1 Tax=Persea americana TaxID=3435 RepID=A0ACC2MCN5_PERAE|nr:hypothetical protein MRB53_005197 [Persea americana]